MKMLIFVTVLTLVGLALVVFESPNRAYWNKVGYEVDRTFNPNKYEVINIEGDSNG